MPSFLGIITLAFSTLAFTTRVFGALTNVTLGLTNPSLSFSTGWQFTRSQATGSIFAFVDDLGVVLTVALPNGTSAVSYVGFKQSRGSAYGVCLDCGANARTINVVNANDPSLINDAPTIPSILFTVDLDSTTPHVMTIRNLPDARFGGTSRLTLDSLIVTTSNGAGGSATNIPITGGLTSPITLTIISTLLPSNSVSTTSSTTNSATGSRTSTIPTSPSSSSSVTSNSNTANTASITTVTQTTSSSIQIPPNTSNAAPTTTAAQTASSSIQISSPGSSSTQSPPFASSNADPDSVGSKGVSTSLIAVISILSAIALLSLLLGLLVFVRTRRRRALSVQLLTDTENNNQGMPRPPGPFTPRLNAFNTSRAGETSRAPSSPRPVNPFTDVVSPDLSSDMRPNPTAMQRRMEDGSPSPSSSFRSFKTEQAWISRRVNTPSSSRFDLDVAT